MRTLSIALLLLVRVVSPAVAQPLVPERLVQGRSIVSANDPRLRITLPKRATYVGTDRWLLYGIADCEVTVFVEADSQHVVQRLYWVQFEAYVPDKPELHYDYSSNEVEVIDGLKFYRRARFGPTDDAVKAGSDAEHVRQLVRAKGYVYPASMMNVRLVHLTDDQQRKEVMVIYAENLQPEVRDWKELLPEGKASGRWPTIQQNLLQRAKDNIKFVEMASS